SNSEVFYARSTDAGASFGTPLIVRTGTPYGGYSITSAIDPKVAADGLGNVYVTYPGRTKDPSGNFRGYPVWISRSTDGGETFQPEFYANSPDGNNYEVSQASARNGSLFVLEADTTNNDAYFYRTTSTTASHVLSRVNQVLHKDGFSASLALDPDGTTIYAAYVDTSVDSSGDIYYTKSSDGGSTWGGYKRVSDLSNNPRYSPVVSLDASGGLHFLWADYRSGSSQIFY